MKDMIRPREPLQGGRGQSLRGIKRLQILFSQVPGSGQSVLSQQGMPPSESRTKVLLQPGGVGSPTRGGQAETWSVWLASLIRPNSWPRFRQLLRLSPTVNKVRFWWDWRVISLITYTGPTLIQPGTEGSRLWSSSYSAYWRFLWCW